MEIIRHGNNKEWRPNYVRIDCPNCDCQFELSEEETRLVFEETIYVEIHCPECGEYIKVPLEQVELAMGNYNGSF